MNYATRACGLIIAFSWAATAAAQSGVDPQNRILDEAFNRSELPQTASYLTDRIGGRMTNSPQMRAAEKWTQEKFRAWGLKNVHAEGFEFGRGWSIENSSVRMLTPRVRTLRSIPIAWTPATQGTLTAQIFVAPIRKERDFAKWKGQLAGKIVLVTRPDEGSEPDKAAFQRYTDEDLRKLDEYQQPGVSAVAYARQLERAIFEEELDAFLVEEGALAWVRMSDRDGGLLHGDGYSYRVGRTPKLPAVELAAEDYRQLARLAKSTEAPTLAIASDVRFHDEDINAYNVIAEIPGRDAKAGYVMAGAHLDSWVASDGAQDNGAGSVVVMEAARILSKLGVKPKRTIRFALWSGEEQALGGSLAYTEKHLATRPALTSEKEKRVAPDLTWNQRWPITPLPGYEQLAAYFNIDNGSGKIRGLYAEGNPAVVPLFKEWLEPFASMGAATVVSQPTTGTDHVLMQQVGIPGFQFIQDPLDYETRIHHSSLDSYDHLKLADLKQATAILASLLLKSAEHAQPLPRMPLPVKPAETNPFTYDDIDE